MAPYLPDTGRAVICVPPCPAVPRKTRALLAARLRAGTRDPSHPRLPGFRRQLPAENLFYQPQSTSQQLLQPGGGGELPRAEWEEVGSRGSKTVIKTPPAGRSPALSKEHGRVPCSFQPFLDVLDGAVKVSPFLRALTESRGRGLEHGGDVVFVCWRSPVPERSCVPRFNPCLDPAHQTHPTLWLCPETPTLTQGSPSCQGQL